MGLIFKQKLLWWAILSIILAFSSSNIIIVAKSHNTRPDQYTEALHKALLFFDAQKSGHLPKNNGVPWRGNSGLQDGLTLSDVKGGLVGGYYDAGDNTKYHFPMAYSMTLLSWSVVEYGHKYKDIGEYDHIRDIIKWGTDYLLRTFNSSAATVNYMYSQVGGSKSNSTTPDDHYCWERPEDMDYTRPVQKTGSAPDLGAEVAAALAAASIVFRDNIAYSTKLLKGATTMFKFARDVRRRAPYSRRNPYIELFYNSTGYWDEYIWGATWLHYATGNSNYINFVTTPGLPKNAKAFMAIPDLRVFSWDNKLPGAELLLTRYWMFLNPGYPQEGTLIKYRIANNINVCSYFKRFNIFFWTEGGLIQMKAGRGRPLQYAVNAAFLASLYADYMTAADVLGMYCGPYFYPVDALRNFAASQLNYVLGDNPLHMSYLVGYGQKYPNHVRHRGASIPRKATKHSCTEGWKWRDTKSPNPNTITGAMVGGPNLYDGFRDVRANYHYNEPTLAGNAGLVAALISFTKSSNSGIDKNTMFSAIPPLFPVNLPPPSSS